MWQKAKWCRLQKPALRCCCCSNQARSTVTQLCSTAAYCGCLSEATCQRSFFGHICYHSHGHRCPARIHTLRRGSLNYARDCKTRDTLCWSSRHMPLHGAARKFPGLCLHRGRLCRRTCLPRTKLPSMARKRAGKGHQGSAGSCGCHCLFYCSLVVLQRNLVAHRCFAAGPRTCQSRHRRCKSRPCRWHGGRGYTNTCKLRPSSCHRGHAPPVTCCIRPAAGFAVRLPREQQHEGQDQERTRRPPCPCPSKVLEALRSRPLVVSNLTSQYTVHRTEAG